METVTAILLLIGLASFGYLYHWQVIKMRYHFLPYCALALSSLLMTIFVPEAVLPVSLIVLGFFVVIHLLIAIEIRRFCKKDKE